MRFSLLCSRRPAEAERDNSAAVRASSGPPTPYRSASGQTDRCSDRRRMQHRIRHSGLPRPRRHRPTTAACPISVHDRRACYWARSAIGWPRIESALPNATHAALARMEDAGAVVGVITQNVDGLHHSAGSRRVIELHGSLAWVVCTQCNTRVRRATFQSLYCS